MHSFTLMKPGDHGGDVKVTWDPEDPESVAEAKAIFDAKVVAGPYNAYKVKKATRQGEPLTEFDPQMGKVTIGLPTVGEVEEVVAVPALAGG